MKNSHSLSFLTERELVIRAARGCPLAFSELDRRCRPALQLQARRMLHNVEDADDAVQEALVKAFKSLDHFDSARPLRPWLACICRNCCLDLIRDRARLPGQLAEGADPADPAADCAALAAEAQELETAVQQALFRLPSRYRRIMLLRHVNEQDVLQIAQEMRAPEGTVKSWLFRGRELLRNDKALSQAVLAG